MRREDIASNLAEVMNFISAIPSRNGEKVTLVAASKTQSIETVFAAAEAGVMVFGENRVQELAQKRPAAPQLCWHFIGHLQTNKVKDVIGNVELIHSADRVGLLDEIDRVARTRGMVQDVLLQINISKEETKGGFYIEDARKVVSGFGDYKGMRLRGLMTMAPFFDDPENARPVFREAREIFDIFVKSSLPSNVSMEYLSMGMSGDYIVALQEGSNMVRIGTAIFGTR